MWDFKKKYIFVRRRCIRIVYFIWDSNFIRLLCDQLLFLFLHCSHVEELENKPDYWLQQNLGQFTNSRGCCKLFRKAYLMRALKALLTFSFYSPLKLSFRLFLTSSNKTVILIIDSNMWFNMVLIFRWSYALLCFLCSVILLQPSSP